MFFCSSICFLIVFFDTMYLTDYVCHLDKMANTDPTFLCCFGSRFFPLCIGMQRTSIDIGCYINAPDVRSVAISDWSDLQL